jgi:addiction module HigA family antidote
MIHTDEEYPVMNTRSDESRIEITYDYGVTPSDMLRQRMYELGMSQTQLAMRTGLSRKTINELVHGKQSITHETALLLEPVLGYAARFWMDMQHAHDVGSVKSKVGSEVGSDPVTSAPSASSVREKRQSYRFPRAITPHNARADMNKLM